MNQTYVITTIKELVDVATEKNVENLMQDLFNFIMFANNPNFQADSTKFVWVDDGKNDVFVSGIEMTQDFLNDLPEGFIYEKDLNQIRNGNLVMSLPK
jgi:hypothetical protein